VGRCATAARGCGGESQLVSFALPARHPLHDWMLPLGFRVTGGLLAAELDCRNVMSMAKAN